MFLRLALLFVTVPLLELALLIQVGRWMGLLATVSLVIVTGILGAALARHQGLATWERFQKALGEGRILHLELVEGLLILVSGAVLLTPGLLTDLAGFLLLVAPLRRRVAGRVVERVGRSAGARTTVVREGRPVARREDDREGDDGMVDDGVVDVDFEIREPVE